MTAVLVAEVQPTTLALADGLQIAVETESDLQAALEGLPRLASGQTAKLAQGPRHYIEAVRHGDLWSVSTRRGSYFTLASFAAEMTTDYSDRQVKMGDANGSIWERVKQFILRPSPERALSTAQVRTLFGEFFAGRKFSLPKSGA
ncbi:hypothetical protein [Sphingomonas elodea]|uniref:hypothetical protein n=1 Tax=Sphingomonas elodea TaxID=179878 RepID=UPI001110EDB2|nr:hypothetical protein [Sphingomonas elodea]